MFSGIIETVGKITKPWSQHEPSITITEPNLLNTLNIGDSISVNGVCLTAKELTPHSVNCDIGAETLRLTNLKLLQEHDFVNLERAITINTRLGGHIVQGHIDETATITNISPANNSKLITFATENVHKYLVTKAYIAIDGLSLTITNTNKNNFTVNIIPHTEQHSIAKYWRINSTVNIEIDIIAKYIEKFNQNN